MSDPSIKIEIGNRLVVGSCNVCLRKDTSHVWVINVLNPDRTGMEIRLCYACMDDLKGQINDLAVLK